MQRLNENFGASKVPLSRREQRSPQASQRTYSDDRKFPINLTHFFGSIMHRFLRLFVVLGSILSVHSLLSVPSSASAQTMQSLFQFADPADASNWQIVNDGVMGGRSSSQASIVKTEAGEDVLRFNGILSLENNGGFASVRSRPSGSLGLDSGETVVLRVKGDGRRYTFNFYTPSRRTAFSYQMEFDTSAGEWIEVRLPVDEFVAHSFGRPMPNMRLKPTEVQSIGILLGDKKPGKFQILIDSIAVE
jgi:monofunctional biosynthetic peptidoglycan transglycosylase